MAVRNPFEEIFRLVNWEHKVRGCPPEGAKVSRQWLDSNFPAAFKVLRGMRGESPHKIRTLYLDEFEGRKRLTVVDTRKETNEKITNRWDIPRERILGRGE